MDRAEANRISSKKYRMAHLDECRSKARDWYHRTKEQRKAYNVAHSKTPARRYGNMKSAAKTRGLEVGITLEEYTRLISAKGCHYCQGPLPEYGSGLDRVDNSKGYVEGNVVPCCYQCNSIKGQYLSSEELMLIINHRRRSHASQCASCHK